MFLLLSFIVVMELELYLSSLNCKFSFMGVTESWINPSKLFMMLLIAHVSTDTGSTRGGRCHDSSQKWKGFQ